MDSLPDLFFADIRSPGFLMATNVNWTIALIVILVFLMILSFFISGGLVALFSLDTKDVNVLKTKQHAPAKRIISLLEEPKDVYVSLLIAGVIVNICIILTAAFLINQYLPFGTFRVLNNGALSFLLELVMRVIAIAFVLVFVGEILPKVYATQNNIRFVFGASFLLEIIHLFLRRVSRRMVRFAERIGRRIGSRQLEHSNLKDLDAAMDINTNDETSEEEKNILKGIIKFPNISVRQIMKARLDVSGIEYNLHFGNLIRRIEELHYSRLPVYKDNLDEIAGVIHTKDIIPFLDKADDFDWHVLMRTAYFVPESKLIKDLLKDFQNKRIHFAVVVDEFGGTSGIVTMEDIMEEIIGDIQDEFDEEEKLIRKLDDLNYVAEGKASLNDLCKTMAIPSDTFDKVRGESESVAGLVLELAGQFPPINEVIPSGDFDFAVLEADKNRIQKVKITIKK